MIADSYTVRILKAEEGKFLVNTDATDVLGKVITTEVYLAANDTPDRWIEITAEEADAIKEEQKVVAEAKRKEYEKELLKPTPRTEEEAV